MKNLSKSVQVKKNQDDDTTFNRLLELQTLLKKESALKELFINTGIETKKNIDKECVNIYKKKMEVLNILQKINNKEQIVKADNNPKDKDKEKQNFKDNILVENNYDYLQVLNTYIPKLLNYLWENPKLIANILMNADKNDTQKYLAPLICNNFYENFLSSNYIEDPLMLILYLLLDNEIGNFKDIKDSNLFLDNTQCSHVLSQLIDKKDVKDFFKIILEDIIEDLGSNNFNFDINDIERNQKKKRKTVSKTIFEKQNTIKGDDRKSELSRISTNSTGAYASNVSVANDPEKYQQIKSNADYQLFSAKYLVSIPLKELTKKKEESSDPSLKDYYSYLLENANNDQNAYSQENFIDSIADKQNAEVVLVLYQQDFMRATEFIDKLFNNLVSNYRLVPYSIKCICKIILELINKKFPNSNSVEKYLLISKFFFNVLLFPILTKPDVNALISNYIISNSIICNAKKICNILLQLVSFKLYKSEPMSQGSNYSPFNIFFLEKIPEVFKFYEKIRKVELPRFIDELINENISINEYNYDYFKENPKEVVFLKSMLLNIDEFNALFKNIINNKEKLFPDCNKENKEKKSIFNIFSKGNKDKDKDKDKDKVKDKDKDKDKNKSNNNNNINKGEDKYKLIKMTLDKINSADNRKLLEELCSHKAQVEETKDEGWFSKKKNTKVVKHNIKYFHFTELLFNEKYKNIFSLEQKNPYYHIKENKVDNTKESKVLNNIIKAKNFINSILYNYRILVKTDFVEGTTNEAIDILKELKLFMKSSNFLIDNNIPSEWYISALIECLRKLPQEYKNNDYEKLFNELKNELIDSIKQYNFEYMSVFIDKMKYAHRNRIYFEKIKGIYMDIELNNKANNIIENDELNVNIQYKFTDKKREFEIYKLGIKDKQLDFLDSFTFQTNNKGKTCKTIEQFAKYFPNLNKRLSEEKNVDEEEIAILKIQEEIELPSKLKVFFNLVSQNIKNNIKDEKELNLINDKIYDYVMGRIYHKIYPKENNITDEKILQQSYLLSWVEPQNIIKSDTHFDFDLVLPDINKYFNSIRNEKSPRKKLLNLTNIFSSINRLLLFSGISKFGVDDQIPLLTYCLIKARPLKLYTDCKFMELYIGEKKNKGEGNYLTQMKTICDYIKGISAKSLYNIDEEEFNRKCQNEFQEYKENYLEEQ